MPQTFGKKLMRTTPILASLLALFLSSAAMASEMTASLADKVSESDLVAIVRVEGVELGAIRVPPDWHGQAQDVTIRATIIERIKGDSADSVEIHAYSTSYIIERENGSSVVGSTAGFSAYGIEAGNKYIAYLRATEESSYRLGWNSNQFLEVISPDGNSVNDIGQTLDQVPLEPKLRKLRSLASGGIVLVILTDPLFLGAVALLIAVVAFLVVRKNRSRRDKNAEQGVGGQPATPPRVGD